MTPKQELILRTENAVLRLLLAGEKPSIAPVLDDTARKIGGAALAGYVQATQAERDAMVKLIAAVCDQGNATALTLRENQLVDTETAYFRLRSAVSASPDAAAIFEKAAANVTNGAE